jgi:hypothetical protein
VKVAEEELGTPIRRAGGGAAGEEKSLLLPVSGSNST